MATIVALEKKPPLKVFTRNTLVSALLLMGITALVLRVFFPEADSRMVPACLGAILLLALNAFLAIGPLHWLRSKPGRDRNPFNIYVGGMLPRLLFIGLALALFLRLSSADPSVRIAAALTSFLAFLVFLGVEVHHFISQRQLFEPGLKGTRPA